MEDLEKLRSRIDKIVHPEGLVEKINGEIVGLGFFPGADGMIGGDKIVSNKKYMFLGQDQDKKSGFLKSVKNKSEVGSTTWNNLKEMLNKAKISMTDCFFTNSILGVRINSKSNLGKSPSIDNDKFFDQCLEFLMYQIRVQKPEAIVCLGNVPLKILCFHSKQLYRKFLLRDSYREVDEQKIGLVRDVVFDDIANFKTTVIALTHPSYRIRNARNRRFRNIVGPEAEIEMLRALKGNRAQS